MTITVFSTAIEMGEAIGAGTTTSRAICQMYLDRIALKNALVNAVVVQRTSAAILADADAADARALAGARLSPLDGVPFTLKLSLETLGVRTANTDASNNAASPLLDGDIAANLKAAGCVLLGKTNGPGQYPFRTKTTLFGETKNPRNPSYATGGSSGGSAAAVAAGFSAFDIGIDSAGSARIPSSFCGVFGIKPTDNAVSGFGDWSIDMPSQPPMQMYDLYSYGPIARSVDDLAAVLAIIAGPTQMRPETPYLVPLSSPAPTLTKVLSLKSIGPWTCNWQSTIDNLLAAQSFVVTPLNISWFSETDMNNIYDGLSVDPGVMASTFPKTENAWYAAQLNYAISFATQYPQARAHSKWLASVLGFTMGKLAGGYDAVVMGTTALSPPLVGSADPASTAYLAFTALWSLTGNPCVTVPCGTDPATGIPWGLQLVGRHGRDFELLAFAKQIVGLPGFIAPAL